MATKIKTPVIPVPVVEQSLQQKMIGRANMWLDFCRPKLNRFADSFVKDPANALEWSSDIFAAAGKLQVAVYVLEVLTMERAEPVTDLAEKLVKSLKEEALRKARWPERSTSIPSNEMSLSLNAARAEFITDLY